MGSFTKFTRIIHFLVVGVQLVSLDQGDGGGIWKHPPPMSSPDSRVCTLKNHNFCEDFSLCSSCEILILTLRLSVGTVPPAASCNG